ncbi:MAG TPA: spore germination protein GerW family protein [Solirubrobacterales bacterium]|nr:spore germination protein GerW family protein [Solirubrobacterales bacterium]
MDVEETIAKARDAITVKRVYGDPHQADGVTVIPAAAVGGGGGGGSGEGPEGEGSGGGAGFGVGARPVGALVIKDGEVSWVPAPDVTRIALQALLALAAVALLAAMRRR